MQPTQPTRQNNFDLIRFLLATTVIASHSYACIFGTDSAEPVDRFTRGRLTLGGVAVDLFFSISGFLIAGSWIRSRGIKGYLRKRIYRICPGFIVMNLVCLSLAPLAGQAAADVWGWRNLGKVAIATAGLEAYPGAPVFRGNPAPRVFNASAWTIRFEFFCYLALPAAWYFGLVRQRKAAVLFAAALVAGMAFAPPLHYPHGGGRIGIFIGDPTTLLRFSASFFTGTAFYFLSSTTLVSARAAAVAAIALAAAFTSRHLIEPAVIVCGSCVVFYLAGASWLKASGFARHGDFSYGIYLYAFPIQQFLVLWQGRSLSAGSLFFLAWPLAVAAGAASWFLVERRFLRSAHSVRPAVDDPDPGPTPDSKLDFVQMI